MRSFSYQIKDPVGIHARPAGILAKKARQFASEIIVSNGEKQANATALMALMALGIKCGNTVTVTVSGQDEERAAAELERFFGEHF